MRRGMYSWYKVNDIELTSLRTRDRGPIDRGDTSARATQLVP